MRRGPSTASASAASSCAGSASPSIRWIIAPTWDFSARPLPVTERFTTAGGYSTTVSPALAASSIATPRACPITSAA